MTTPTAGAAAAAGFSQLELERRLSQLKESAESVQSLSSWCLKHQHQHRRIVNTWLKVLKRVKNPQRLALFYLANDVIQRSKRKTMDFVDSFHSVLEAAMPLVRDEKLRPAISRILKIWHERSVFDDTFIDSLGAIVENVVKADSEENARIISSFRMDDLVARVRQVEQTEQDTDTRLRQLNLCHFHATNANIDHVRANVKSRAESREFVAELDECVQAVQSYVTALNSELQLRSELIDHLEQADIYYETQRNDVKIVATAYKNFGRRLRELKKKLEEALPSLTDLSPVPSPDVNAPSPTGSDDLLDLPDDETAGNGVTDCSTQRSPVGSLAGQQPQRPADADPRSEMQRLIGRWTADIGGQTETTDEVFQSSDRQDQRLLTASTTTTAAAATTATATNSNNSSDSGGGTAIRRGPSCDQRLAQLFPGMFSPPAASPAAAAAPAAAVAAAEALNCSTGTTLHDMFQQQQHDDVGGDDSSSGESNHLFPACREPIDMARLTANLLGSPSLIRQPTAADHETDTDLNNLHALYDDAADISNHQQQHQEQQAQSDDDEDEDDDDHLVTHIVRRVDARLQQQQQQQQWGVNGSAAAWPTSATDVNCGVGEGAADLGHMMKSAAAVAIPGLDLSRPPPSAPPPMDPPPSAPPFLDPPPSAPPLLDLPPSSVGAVTSTNVGLAPLFQRAPPPTPVLAPVTLGAASSSNNNSSSVWSRTVDEFIEKLKCGRGVTALTTSASAAKTSSAPINHDTDQRQALHHHSGSLSHHHHQQQHHQQQHQQQPLPHRDTDAHLSRPTSLSSASSTMSMSSLSPSPVAPRAARDTDYRRHSYHSTASPPPAAAAAAAATQQHNHQQQQQQRPHTEPLLPLPAAFAHQLPLLPHLISTPSLLPAPFAAITTTPFSTTATATPLGAHSSDGSTTTIVKNTNNNSAAASGGDGDGGGVARRELIEYVACLGVFRRIKQEPVDDKDDDGVRAECIPLPGEVSSAATATTTTAIRSEAQQQQQQCLGPLPAPLRVRDPPPHLAQSAADDDVHQGGDELDSDQPELVWYGQPDRTPPPLVDIADRPNTPPHTKQHHSRRHHDHHQQQRHRSTSTSRRNCDARHKKRRHHRHGRHRRDSSSTASTPSRTTPSRSDSVHSSSSRDSTPRGTASHSRRPRHSRTSSSRTHRRDRRSHSSHRHHRSRRRRSSSSHHHHQQQHRRRRHRNESAGSDSSHDSSAHRHRRTDSRLSRTDESHRHSRHRHREQQQEEQQQQQQQKHRKHSREETSRADADRGKGGVRRGRKRGSRSSGGGSSDSSAGGGGGAARSRRKDDRKRHQNETHRQRRDSGDAPIMASSSSGGRHEYSYSHAAAGVRHGDKHSSRSKRQR